MWYALIAANLTQAGLFAYTYKSLPPQIPIFYSKTEGEEQLGDLWMIAILPILMNLIIFINTYVYRKYFKENIFVKHLFFVLNIFLITSFTIIFFKILFTVS